MLIVSILLVALYVGATIWKHKELPESISAMVYNLPKQGQWLWTVWLAMSDIFAAPAVFESLPETFQFLGFFFTGSLLFVSAMPLVRHSRNKPHEILAILAGIFSQACVLFICWWWILTWFIFIIILVCVKKWGVPIWMTQSGVFILEIQCVLPLYGSLFTNLLTT